MAEIKITIDKSTFPPSIFTEVDGMKGEGCTKFLDELQEALRLKTRQQTLKPDFKEARLKLPMRR